MTTRHACAKLELLLHGLADGELDALNAARCESHVAGCARCEAELRAVRGTRRVVAQPGARWPLPVGLDQRVADAIAGERRARSQGLAAAWLRHLADSLSRWSLPLSAAVLTASLALFVLPKATTADLRQELVASHVRAMLADHLTDVATSDRHQVKPWFNGRVAFSPPVVDLSALGFPLIGGRVDYIGGRVVGALVYKRHEHIINLFVWPSGAKPWAHGTSDGYNLVNWSQAGLTFWAVSDLNAVELEEFRQDFAEAAPG